MALVPYRKRQGTDLASVHRDIDDLFNSFLGGWPAMTFETKVWPALDVTEKNNEFLVTAEVPGCKAEDIDISVHGNTLCISGEKKQESEKEEKGYYHLERTYGSFRREVALPNDVDTDKVDAVCKDGILSIKLPKSEKAKSIKVKVKS